MPVVQAAIPNVCPCMKLIDLWWLILIHLIPSVIEHHPVCTVYKLEPFSFLVLFGRLKRLSLTANVLLCTAHRPSLNFFLTCSSTRHHSWITCFTAIFTYFNKVCPIMILQFTEVTSSPWTRREKVILQSRHLNFLLLNL